MPEVRWQRECAQAIGLGWQDDGGDLVSALVHRAQEDVARTSAARRNAEWRRDRGHLLAQPIRP